MGTHENNVPSVYYQNGFVATHALGEMNIGQMTHCWYQWTNDDHFIYQGFQNSAKRWEVSIPPLEAGESYILLEGRIFLMGLWKPEEEWFWIFFKAKNSFI